MLNHLKASYSFSSQDSVESSNCMGSNTNTYKSSFSKAKNTVKKRNHLRLSKKTEKVADECSTSYDFVGVAG